MLKQLSSTLLLLLLPKLIYATTVVAVIDSGVDKTAPNLCKTGHKSFTNDKPLVDVIGHGTHVAGLISQNAGDGDYCIISIKYYSPNNSGSDNLKWMIKGVEYALEQKVKFINISGGGPLPSDVEKTAIIKALDNKITVVAAAGNEGDDLDQDCNYYPACYDKRIVVVGNKRNSDDLTVFSAFGIFNFETPVVGQHPSSKMVRNESSNYGKYVKRWEMGTNVQSNLPGGKKGYMTGTSQAAAIATGKLLKDYLAK